MAGVQLLKQKLKHSPDLARIHLLHLVIMSNREGELGCESLNLFFLFLLTSDCYLNKE